MRFIVVLICGLCFASAGYASVAMPCCDEQAQVESQDMPCHEHGQEQHAPAKSDHKPMSAKLCNCLGNMQQAVAGDAAAAQSVALDAGQGIMIPLAFSASPQGIYHPPRAIS